MAAGVTAIVVTFNAMPYIDRCLESVRGHETIVVDHGSSDGTVELVRELFPEDRVIEQENLGLGAGRNRGMREASGEWFLILNADAWMADGATEKLAGFGDSRPDAAVIGPRMGDKAGRRQRPVREPPTQWRLPTQLLAVRKLGPRKNLFNAFYAN